MEQPKGYWKRGGQERAETLFSTKDELTSPITPRVFVDPLNSPAGPQIFLHLPSRPCYFSPLPHSKRTDIFKVEKEPIMMRPCRNLFALSWSVVSNSLWPHGLQPVHGSSVHGILQARMQEWVAISSSKGSSWPRDRTCVSYVSCTGRQILYHCTAWEAPSLY